MQVVDLKVKHWAKAEEGEKKPDVEGWKKKEMSRDGREDIGSRENILQSVH